MAETRNTGVDRTGTARIAVVQYELRKIPNFEAFAKQCSFYVTTAASYKADFVLFPELFTTQLMTYMDDVEAKLANQLADLTQQYVDLFSNLARKNKVHVIAGSHLCRENGKLHNISFLFDREGRASKQYKIHITPVEKELWNVAGGDTVEIFDTDCGKVCILICYDIEFPELSRIAAAKGAQIIFCPSNTDQRFGYLRVRYCAQARCIENQVYVALSGVTGNTEMVGAGEIHYSQSAIFTPSDLPFMQEAIAAQCVPNVEGMIVQDVDLNLLERSKKFGSVRPWLDRRTDLYQVVFTDSHGKQQI